MSENIDKTKVIELNDRLRIEGEGGKIVCTLGIDHLEESIRSKVFQAIQEFFDFTPENDPYGEHDLGSVKVNDVIAFWKIDYYDKNLKFHSPAKDNPDVTERVMTILLPEEY